MAKIETIRWDLGNGANPRTKEKWGVYDENAFNLSAQVGPRMPNRMGDVIVIQAMLNVIASERVWSEYNGLKLSLMPQVTGKFEQKTERAIRSFQEARHYNLVRVDGVVHPGAFENRIIRLDASIMSISLLNMEAGVVCSFKYNSLDHTKEIARLYPQVIAAIYL